MRSALVAAGIALTGTALGAAAYTVVSGPSSAAGDPVAPVRAATERTVCKPPDKIVPGTCVTVVHVRPRADGPGGGSTAPAAPAPAPAPVAAVPPAATPVTIGHDAFDDHGGDRDDDVDERDDWDDDQADAREDDRDDYLDDREDAFEDRDDDRDDD
jgi:hypothetical protein